MHGCTSADSWNRSLNYGSGQVNYNEEFPALPARPSPPPRITYLNGRPDLSSKRECASADRIEAPARTVVKICDIQGRMLTSKDEGEYLVRPQPWYNLLGMRDMSFVPCEGYERFTDTQLVTVESDATLMVRSEKGCVKKAWFPNDGGWITVKELQAHLALTGERLRSLVPHRNSPLDFYTQRDSKV